MTQGIVSAAKASAAGSNFPLPAVEHDWANGQRIAISTSNAYSAAVNSPLAQIRPTLDCFVTVSPATSGGSAVAASTSAATSWPLSANETYSVVLQPGYFIAVIAASGSGFLYIHPIVDN